MIDAEIYGITPSEKIEKFARAPPDIASYNSHNDKLETAPCVPGTGIVLPIMNINKHANVNNTLLLISLFARIIHPSKIEPFWLKKIKKNIYIYLLNIYIIY